LRFCIETKNILYASLVPFLVTEIFNRLETLEAQKPGQQVVENRLAGISQDASDDSVDEEDPDADMTAINGTMSRTLNMSSLSVSMSQADKSMLGKSRVKDQEKPVYTDEELLQSDSESYKAIFALVKLFMSKSAHSSLSVRQPHDDNPVLEKNYNNYVIIQAYIDRLRHYAEIRIEPMDHKPVKQKMKKAFNR